MGPQSRFKLSLLGGFLLTITFAMALSAGVAWLRGSPPLAGLHHPQARPRPAAPSPSPTRQADAPRPGPARPTFPFPVRWTASVAIKTLDELADPAPLLARPATLPHRTDKLTMTGGTGRGHDTVIGTIADYLSCRRAGMKPKTPADAALEPIVKGQLYPLLYLRRAWPSQTSFVANFNLAGDPLNGLPVALSPAVSPEAQRRRAQAVASGGTWKKLLPGARATAEGPFATRIADREYDLRLAVLAWGDFNHDGYEDVLLSGVCTARRTTYISSYFVVLTRTAAGGPLTVLDVQE